MVAAPPPAVPTRDAVDALIRQRPGITQRALQDHLQVAWGTIAHHVQCLVEEGRVEEMTSHRRRSLFPPHVPPHLRAGLAVLHQDPVETVHRHLIQTGCSREYEIADGLGLSRRTVRRALQKMSQAGLVDRRGQHTAWYDACPLPGRGEEGALDASAAHAAHAAQAALPGPHDGGPAASA